MQHYPKVTLTVIQGPEQSKIFEFVEQDNFLVGRDAEGSHAHFRLSPNDKYVSRNHFLLEINPPDCYLRDVDSKNGTYIVREMISTGPPGRTLFFLKGRGEGDWLSLAKQHAKRFDCKSYKEVEDRIKMEDGDLIIVGETVIGVKVSEQISEPFKESPISREEVQRNQEILHCIHCGKELPIGILRKEAKTLTSNDFLCKECLEKQHKKPVPKETVLCWECRKDLSSLANSDGRAEELKDIALYWCKNCASSKQEGVSIPMIADYRLLKELGLGGFGVVYLAWHKTTGRIVALKLTKEKIKKNKGLIKRFKREITIMQELRHPHLVKLYGEGTTEEENDYLVSEYLPEGSLADLFHRGYGEKMPYKEACYYISQALEGLSYFHKKGYVHRDLKPENILLRKNDKGKVIAKVGDFGLARSYILHGGTITKPGEWAGTIFYCSPEQITNFKDAKPYSDVYAMGISLYFLITGEFPYDFPTRKRFMEMISKGEKPRDPIYIILGDDEPTPIEEKRPGLPKKLAKAINRAIEKDASKRFDSANEFKKAIEEYII